MVQAVTVGAGSLSRAPMPRLVRLSVSTLGIVLLSLSFAVPAAALQRVVILTSLDGARPTQNAIIAPVLRGFSDASEPIESYAETVDAGSFPAAEHEARLTAFLRD